MENLDGMQVKQLNDVLNFLQNDILFNNFNGNLISVL